ncbi:Uncharacterised protein [Citrobacter koseri]|nr:Uncharacterised protein [Citrobacter koseri]
MSVGLLFFCHSKNALSAARKYFIVVANDFRWWQRPRERCFMANHRLKFTTFKQSMNQLWILSQFFFDSVSLSYYSLIILLLLLLLHLLPQWHDQNRHRSGGNRF